MPSEQRLHPATLIFDLLRHLRAFAVPAVLVIFGMARSSGGPAGMFGRLPDGWEVWLLLLFVPATLVSIFRYVTFRLSYHERELVIRSGFIFRNERHIPFSRIQNVDAVQNFLHRLLGVVEVRVETGGGQEEEARLSVLPLSALDEIRSRVFGGGTHAIEEAPPQHPTLLHLPPRELVLFGFLENKGMVLIAAAVGVAWQADVLDFAFDRFFGGVAGREVARGVARRFEEGAITFVQIGEALAAVLIFLVVIRMISMLWAFIRLYDFRLTRVGEDLRTEYGLITRVAATVPIRRVQSITIRTSLLHRWLDRSAVRVATAGGAGAKNKGQKNDRVREWLAPLIRNSALPHLLHQVLPGFDITTIDWQPVHPRAFRRAVKPSLFVAIILSVASATVLGWSAIWVLIGLTAWSVFIQKKYVAHLGWAESEEVVMMKSGWIWRQVTLARVNKIQAVTMSESPFDRRAAMARVKVDTAGAPDLFSRIDIPYLDRGVAGHLADRLAVAAANTAFRW